MSYFCNICDKTINHKSRKGDNKRKRHYFMKNFVTNTYNYNDFVWDVVERTFHEIIVSHNNKFIEFKSYVSIKINDDVEIKKYKDEQDLCVVLHTFLGVDTLYVHVASEKVCNIIRKILCSRYDINCTPDMNIKNLSMKIVSHYGNMTFSYYMQQPRQMIETEIVEHVKNMSEEEKNFIDNFLTCKHTLSLF